MRYFAIYSNAAGRYPNPQEPGILDARTQRFHARPEYSDIDLANICRWLNNIPSPLPEINVTSWPGDSENRPITMRTPDALWAYQGERDD